MFVLAAAEGCLHTRGVEDEQKEQMMNALTKQVRLVEKSYVNCCVLDYYLSCGGQGWWEQLDRGTNLLKQMW